MVSTLITSSPATSTSSVHGHAPRPMKWTVAEFHRINSTGIWEGRRPYLLNGVIVEQGPMNPPHATASILFELPSKRSLGRA
jgi:hypothetical protein